MDYLKVLGFQLQVDLDCDEKKEFLISNDSYHQQMKVALKLIQKEKPDVILFPEMCYDKAYEKMYRDFSNNSLFVAGSTYIHERNVTIVYQNGEKRYIPKRNASGAEPMVRFYPNVSTDDFIKYFLKEHTFIIKNKKIILLNCMEYYQHAYRIAREVDDIFGIFCIASNSNQRVFLEETKAIHNHQDDVYSFVLNGVTTYQGKSYGKGFSYIFGPIQYHEQEWLQKEGKKVLDHTCSIGMLSSEPEYFVGEFTNHFSRFGRSDRYIQNPLCFKTGKIEGERKMNIIKNKDEKEKKNIVITAGPTNERLDAVMKITNMSTGALGKKIAEEFWKEEENIQNLYYLSPKLARKPEIDSEKVHLISIESARDLLEELKKIFLKEKIYAMVHSAAVGDYVGKYATTSSMLASEIAQKTYQQSFSYEEYVRVILEILNNPENIISDEHKISSYEQELMFHLALTPKVISSIKKLSPMTRLFGFKLLDGVSKEELIQVASALRAKNNAEYIIANDLSQIGNGKHLAYFVGEQGVDYVCQNKEEIARTLRKIIF